ncbi:MAG: DUF5615 family PIN-like protein [Bacteroidota bacterium]
MKLLLDENLPIKLKHHFSNTHEVSTVREQNWSGIKNGRLLQLLTDNQFDGLVTMDKNLKYQQNLDDFNIQIIVLVANDNKISTLQPLVEELERELAQGKEEKVIEVRSDLNRYL